MDDERATILVEAEIGRRPIGGFGAIWLYNTFKILHTDRTKAVSNAMHVYNLSLDFYFPGNRKDQTKAT